MAATAAAAPRDPNGAGRALCPLLLSAACCPCFTLLCSITHIYLLGICTHR